MSDGKDMREKEIQEYRERLKKIVEEMGKQKQDASNDIQRYMEQIDMIRKELQEKLQNQSQKKKDVMPEIKNNGESEIKKEIKKRVKERNKRLEEIKGKLRDKSGIVNDEQKIGIMAPTACCPDGCILTDAANGCSVAEGSGTTASGTASHAEGSNTTASGDRSHAEGSGTEASGLASHAEGSDTEASGTDSHAEGSGTTASGEVSHAEGFNTTASGIHAHAEGSNTIASGIHAHAEGFSTMASGFAAHAQGNSTVADSFHAHAEGVDTRSNGINGVHIMGSYGDANDLPFSWYLANGIGPANRGLAAKILRNGTAFADVGWFGGGADYAEMFETADGNPIDVGYFVTFDADSDKIRKANEKDTYILGIISANPVVLGDSAELRWEKKYLTDEWGRIQYKEVVVPAVKDKEGNIIIPEYKDTQPILNPQWDPNKNTLPV